MRLVLLLSLAGCDWLFGLHEVAPRPDSYVPDVTACTPSRDDTMDEDCDGISDAVDPCPADIEQTDIDGDQVGDVCDPDNAAVDRIVLFDGFPGPPVAWQVSTGTWSVDSGMLGNAGTDGTIAHPVSTSHFLLETHVFVTSFGASPLVTIGATDASGDGYQCRIYPEAGGVKIQAAVVPMGGTATLGPLTEVLGSGHVRVQVIDESTNTLACRAQYSTTSSGASPVAKSTAVTATNIALATSSADVLFDSVTVTGL